MYVKDGRTALHEACAEGQQEVAQLLCDRGAVVVGQDKVCGPDLLYPTAFFPFFCYFREQIFDCHAAEDL